MEAESRFLVPGLEEGRNWERGGLFFVGGNENVPAVGTGDGCKPINTVLVSEFYVMWILSPFLKYLKIQ